MVLVFHPALATARIQPTLKQFCSDPAWVDCLREAWLDGVKPELFENCSHELVQLSNIRVAWRNAIPRMQLVLSKQLERTVTDAQRRANEEKVQSGID